MQTQMLTVNKRDQIVLKSLIRQEIARKREQLDKIYKIIEGGSDITGTDGFYDVEPTTADKQEDILNLRLLFNKIDWM